MPKLMIIQGGLLLFKFDHLQILYPFSLFIVLLIIFTLQLANPNTPIHKWTLPGLPKDIELSIKRDDMTGSTLSGNKVISVLSDLMFSI